MHCVCKLLSESQSVDVSKHLAADLKDLVMHLQICPKFHLLLQSLQMLCKCHMVARILQLIHNPCLMIMH